MQLRRFFRLSAKRQRQIIRGTFSICVAYVALSFSSHLRRSEKQVSLPRLHLLMAASHASPEFCRSLTTALVEGYEPVLLGWGMDWGEHFRNRAAKIYTVHQYLQHNLTSPADLVLVVDGFDVWFQLPSDILIGKYLAMIKGTEPILLGADKKCFPEEVFCTDLPESTLPDDIYGEETDLDEENVNNRPRFVNSGMVIGFAGAMRELYSEMVPWLDEDPYGDQVVFAEFYQSRTHNMTLDFESQLFMNLAYAKDDVVWMPDVYGISNSSRSRVYTGQQMFWNRLTGNLPATLHFPGRMKPLMYEWWPRMWYGKLSVAELSALIGERKVLLSSNRKSFSWNDLCYSVL